MFRSVSPSFANRVSQVSQIRVSQGFANTNFAVLRLFRKIRKVSQIQVFASLRKYKFRKVSQLGFSFLKVSQVSQGFRNGQFADERLLNLPLLRRRIVESKPCSSSGI